MSSFALFLDRDGVINVDYGYVYRREEFDFIDGIFEVARHARKKRYKLVVVTNQSGIARGFYTERDFHYLTDWMCEQFLAANAPIDKVYYSPYHPTEGLGQYLKNDYSRKPNPGMLLQAQSEFSIDLSRSILIGNKMSDIQAGNAAGVSKNLLFANEHPVGLSTLNYNLVTNLHDVIPHL